MLSIIGGCCSLKYFLHLEKNYANWQHSDSFRFFKAGFQSNKIAWTINVATEISKMENVNNSYFLLFTLALTFMIYGLSTRLMFF